MSWLKRLIERLLVYLLGFIQEQEKQKTSKEDKSVAYLLLPPGVPEILEEVSKQVAEMDEIEGVSGEYRRMMVYGRTVKKYHGMAPWKIGLAIEVAVMKRRGIL